MHNLEVIELNHSPTHQVFTEKANNKYTNIYTRASLRSLTFGVIFFTLISKCHWFSTASLSNFLTTRTADSAKAVYLGGWMVKIPYRTTYWQKNYLGGSRTVPVTTVQPGSYQENSPELKDWDMDSTFRDGEQKQTPRFQKLPGLFRTPLPLWIWLHITLVQLHEKAKHSWTSCYPRYQRHCFN